MNDSMKVCIQGQKSGTKDLVLNNPVIAASGTFGFGREYADYVDLNQLGAIVVKGLTPDAREGNPTPRIVETEGGMINSIGLQNPGVEKFIREEMPILRQYDTKIIVNISGNTKEEFVLMAKRLSSISGVDALEINVSCPNIHGGGEVFATNPQMVYVITKAVRERTDLPVIVKLSPNVTDIAAIAQQAEAGGADAVSLINTVLAMAIDIHTQKPVLKKVFGGLSGPAVKPIAIRQVWQVYRAITIPIIGMGGIMDGSDAVEFLLAGATAVSVGTANFINPTACVDVLTGIKAYMEKHHFSSVSELSGVAHGLV